MQNPQRTARLLAVAIAIFSLASQHCIHSAMLYYDDGINFWDWCKSIKLGRMHFGEELYYELYMLVHDVIKVGFLSAPHRRGKWRLVAQ